MSCPSPSTDRSPHSNPKVCTACDSPMRGHTRVNRRLVCPTPEKINETLHQLWDEGHQEFVLSTVRKLDISFTPPSLPISPMPSTLAQRLRNRRPTPAPFDNQMEDRSRIPNSKTSVAGSLRRMLSVVIDTQTRPTPPTPPSRSATPTPSDVPVAHPQDLASVGIWDENLRRQMNAPPELERPSGSDHGSMVPTLLIGSDGQTIREGSRAEAHFRAQAALEVRMQQELLQRPGAPRLPRDASLPALSAVHADDDGGKGDGYYKGSGFLRVLRSVAASPAIVAIPIRPEDIPRVQETAARHGLYTSVLDVMSRYSNPGSRMAPVGSSLSRQESPLKGAGSDEADLPIIVIGRDQATTLRYVEMAQRGVMPGTLAMDQDMLSAPRLITISQLIFISFFSVITAWSLFFFFLL